MSNFVVACIFAIFTSVLSLKFLNADAKSADYTTLLEYYKLLAKSGFLKKSENAKYVASIKRVDIETSYAEHHICAGAVISEKSILISAECTYDKKRALEPHELTAVVGIQYGSMYDQFAQSMPVKRIRRHSDYQLGKDEHNLAILLLNDTFLTISDTVKPAELATKPPINYENCQAVGYGVLYFQDAKLSQILEGELKIWPMRLCQTYLSQYEKDDNLFFCAGDLREPSLAPCKMIASEPLFCREVLYGISVFSMGCESAQGFASVYVNVWKYIPWISLQTELLRDEASMLNCNVIWMMVMLLMALLSRV